MKRMLFFILLTAVTFFPALAQEEEATVTPTMTYVDDKGNTLEVKSIDDGEAPLEVTFNANPVNMGSHTPAYEWHFRREGQSSDMMVRYEENTTYQFMESGTYSISLVTTLTDTGKILDSDSLKVTISESKLEMPNAFSPNDDQKNDIYRAKKDKYKSIVEFHAYIFNRWGQKLFEWTDITQGWDGTYHGSPVKEGVYFVLVNAKGADGREYHIRKDVNLLRGYSESTSNTTTP